jgi:PAS domain S-box-containing protein
MRQKDPPDGAATWLEELSPHGVFTTDERLRILTWNRWLITHSGLELEEVEGRNLLELYPSLAERGLDRLFQQALTGQTAVLSQRFHGFLLPMPPTDSTVPFKKMLQSAQISPLPMDGGAAGTLTVIQDVTERVLREEELRVEVRERTQALETLRVAEERFRGIFQAAASLIVSVDDQGVILECNERAIEYLGVFAEELKGRPVTQILVPEQHDMAMECHAELFRRGGTDTREFTLVRHDGTTFDARFSSSAVKGADGQFAMAICLIDDITEAKGFARERESLIGALQDALDQVKRLSGLLPICAHCKRIRDDTGYWKQIESYIRDHSEAEFSHSICPDCLAEHYPGFET